MPKCHLSILLQIYLAVFFIKYTIYTTYPHKKPPGVSRAEGGECYSRSKACLLRLQVKSFPLREKKPFLPWARST